jgi:anti-sigma regulatory factor (Ser/Thr protein kinase)
MAEQVEITVASHPRWHRLVRNLVQEYAREAGFDRQDSHSITLAVGEAIGNVLKHAYQGCTDRRLTVSCSSSEQGVEVQILDNGQPFDPNTAPDLEPDEVRPGGRGLFLMRTIMDEVEYGRKNGLNVVRMKKLLPTTCETS